MIKLLVQSLPRETGAKHNELEGTYESSASFQRFLENKSNQKRAAIPTREEIIRKPGETCTFR